MFSSGIVGFLFRYLTSNMFKEGSDEFLLGQCLMAITNISDKQIFCERLRDIGAVSTCLDLFTHANLEDVVSPAVDCVYNFSQCDALQSMMRKYNMLGRAKPLLQASDDLEVQATIVIAIANIYGEEENNAAVENVLREHDVSGYLLNALDACQHNDSEFEVSVLQDQLQMAEDDEDQLQMAEDKEDQLQMAEDEEDQLQMAEDEEGAHLLCLRALVRMSDVKSLVPRMLEIGIADAVEPFADSEDLRTQDAAKGCMLNLRQLNDAGAQSAAEAISGGASDMENRRSDARDFCRALYNLLIVRGIKTFLDFEYREELNQLDKIVSRSQNFIFILTDNIFESNWCMVELVAAVKSQLDIIVLRGQNFIFILTDNIFESNWCMVELVAAVKSQLDIIVSRSQNFIFILTDNIFESNWCMVELVAAVKSQVNIIWLVKDGARWNDKEGNPTCVFPPDFLIQTLPEEVRHVFTRKSINHSDEYYQAFVEQLLHKIMIKTAQPPTAAQPSGTTRNDAAPVQGQRAQPGQLRGGLGQQRGPGQQQRGPGQKQAATSSYQDLSATSAAPPGGVGAQQQERIFQLRQVPQLAVQASAIQQPAPAVQQLPPAIQQQHPGWLNSELQLGQQVQLQQIQLQQLQQRQQHQPGLMGFPQPPMPMMMPAGGYGQGPPGYGGPYGGPWPGSMQQSVPMMPPVDRMRQMMMDGGRLQHEMANALSENQRLTKNLLAEVRELRQANSDYS
eukprot:gene19166-25775_t